ncbi:N-acetylmuramoyl-L-alanine amidase [Adlercreutzia muris]|uniref:N-acetylmuramoyl-L-alanine amidase n=1 Tax=Adlercreutzia muris TaxID=1796610 RepID=UPI0021D588FF|nr:peptidoglycan recognition family protein [Adlercreutzia muris]MCU7584075.1 N-acetylmuramoyl-L-alanine amidase [Adlercreutzia muris]
MAKRASTIALTTSLVLVVGGALCLWSCSAASENAGASAEAVPEGQVQVERYDHDVSDVLQGEQEPAKRSEEASRETSQTDGVRGQGKAGAETPPSTGATSDAADLKAQLGIVEDFRPSLSHGPKTAAHQRYIVLHDTEGNGSPSSVVDWWDSNGNLVAAHFVVGKDGSIVQCVPLDEIAHHAGYGDAGHNDLYGIQEDGRDDMEGSSPIGAWAPDYALNAWSIGIEMVHMGGEGDYPAAQLEAVDGLIAYIDAYYGFESDIIDHKAWRSGNSDTSEEFAGYLRSYQSQRVHE